MMVHGDQKLKMSRLSLHWQQIKISSLIAFFIAVFCGIGSAIGAG
jgi:hypothetical protein